MTRTIAEINEKIRRGQAVVATAEEVIGIVEKKGIEKAAREVDVVTTATFGPMCSSGAYFNVGHSKPQDQARRRQHVYLNDVPVYTGVAAVDFFLGATAMPDNDPRNRIYPGEFLYGGGHVIEELVAGKDVRLVGTAYGTDCYPRKKIETTINLKNINEAVLFNMRNAYQNYNVAVNLSDKTIYTYMGVLKPNLGNANFCSAGQLSPLLNDPYYKTIGIGTRIFLGGGIGLRGLAGHAAQPRCAQDGERRAEARRGHAGSHRGPQADETGVAARGELPGVRLHPGGGDRRAHPHTVRREPALCGGQGRGHPGPGGRLLGCLPAAEARRAGRGELRSAQERQDTR